MAEYPPLRCTGGEPSASTTPSPANRGSVASLLSSAEPPAPPALRQPSLCRMLRPAVAAGEECPAAIVASVTETANSTTAATKAATARAESNKQGESRPDSGSTTGDSGQNSDDTEAATESRRAGGGGGAYGSSKGSMLRCSVVGQAKVRIAGAAPVVYPAARAPLRFLLTAGSIGAPTGAIIDVPFRPTAGVGDLCNITSIACQDGLTCQGICIPFVFGVGDPCGPALYATPSLSDPICFRENLTCVITGPYATPTSSAMPESSTWAGTSVESFLNNEPAGTETATFEATTDASATVQPSATLLERAGACHALSGVGGSCGGFRLFPPVCRPGLVCARPGRIMPDLPGSCHKVANAGGACGYVDRSGLSTTVPGPAGSLETLCMAGYICTYNSSLSTTVGTCEALGSNSS
ncbi:hypothetical protein HK405_011423 [Cladochytrium tenue]|nr:hypothetical protein HK405_011423 [Cladochytrium tenue]